MTSKKPLPTINHPSLSIDLPLSKKKVKFRPFIVREQQVLLLANQSDDPDSIYATITDVLTSCTGGSVDLETISLCDLSYLFLQMHIASVGSDITLKTECEDPSCKYDILMNFDLSNVGISDAPELRIQLTSDVGMRMRYPTYRDTLDLAKIKADAIAAIYLLVDTIYDTDSVYDKTEYELEEFRDWFLTMSDTQLEQVYQFVDKIPDICYDLKYHCPKCKKEHSKRLEGLQTFFRLSASSKVGRGILPDEYDPDA